MAAHCYQTRMQRVLEYIDQHPDADLETICAIAAFSKYHFHRQFSAIFGLSVHRYAQLIRLKRASYQLAFRAEQSVTHIALDAGYDAPDAFARAFRQRFGQAPSSFRKTPDWASWLAALGLLDTARNLCMPHHFSQNQVTIRMTAPVRVAIMEHRGDPTAIGATIQRFIAWRKTMGLSPKVSRTFNIFHHDPRTAAPEAYRLSLCASIERTFKNHDPAVTIGEIPGGRCAVLRVIGNTDTLEPAARYLYRDWLPISGEEPRDAPLYCERLAFFPDVPAHEAVADLFLPLQAPSSVMV